MSEEEIKAKLELVRIDTQKKRLSLRECLSAMSEEKFENLYQFYVSFEKYKRTKQDRVNYLVKKIPSYFIDEYIHMMNVYERELIIKIFNFEKIKYSTALLDFAETGYIYINSNNELILPIELIRFLEQFDLIVWKTKEPDKAE